MVIVNRLAARKRLAAVTLAVSVLPGITLFLAPTALADAAGGPASCMGFEASALSPPGSNEELLAGMRGFNQFFRETFPGTPSGQFIRTIAQLHEGSHAACDEALEG
jgi:hypothetical protein